MSNYIPEDFCFINWYSSIGILLKIKLRESNMSKFGNFFNLMSVGVISASDDQFSPEINLISMKSVGSPRHLGFIRYIAVY